MTYQEQLLDDRWIQKRKKILFRDNYTCQECENKSYDRDVSVGLVVSNSLNFLGKTHFALAKWRFLVWNLSENSVFRGGIDDPAFSEEKSYICYYRMERVNGLWKYRTLGLKEIPNSEVQIKKVDLIETITENDYKKLIEEETFNLIYSSSIEPQSWSITMGLQVHHKYYQEEKYAWDYPDEALVTLCPNCHEEVHHATAIPVLDESGNVLVKINKSNVLRNHKRIQRRTRNS